MGQEDGEFYGIVLEWIDGAETRRADVTLDVRCKFIRGLIRIHNAGVYHNDPFERNMLIIPGIKEKCLDRLLLCIDRLLKTIMSRNRGFAGARNWNSNMHCYQFADLKLMDRSKEEGRAEVYIKIRCVNNATITPRLLFDLLGMALHRRPNQYALSVHQIPFIGVSSIRPGTFDHVFHHRWVDICSVAHLHWTSAARHVFRATLLIHQITVAALSLWRYICSKTNDQLREQGFD